MSNMPADTTRPPRITAVTVDQPWASWIAAGRFDLLPVPEVPDTRAGDLIAIYATGQFDAAARVYGRANGIVVRAASAYPTMEIIAVGRMVGYGRWPIRDETVRIRSEAVRVGRMVPIHPVSAKHLNIRFYQQLPPTECAAVWDEYQISKSKAGVRDE